MEYEAVIGLEVHAQVHTKSKMYCPCPVVEDVGTLPANTYVCPICLALPGTLPVVNRRAVEYGIMTALALHCTVEPLNVFSRKSYFYPDLPKGYQISQYDLPLSQHGYLEIETAAGTKKIGITRVHLEEDTAKIYHVGPKALIDFNRAGVPLLEIVSEPDLRTIDEIKAYANALHDILVYLGVNSGDMEKGEMRFEANVSIRPKGSTTLGTRTEVKNLNSFRALARSVEYEIQRQTAVLESGGKIIQQTMGWDEVKGETFAQRSKEQAHDYRYFPEPDIPPLEVSAEWTARLAGDMPELPMEKLHRLMNDYNIRRSEAELLIVDRAVADYFEQTAKLGQEQQIPPQECANWITGEIFRLLNETHKTFTAELVPAPRLIALLALRQKGTLSSTAAKTVMETLFTSGEEPSVIVDRLGLAQISDEDALTAIVQQVIAANPTQVGQYLQGKNVLGWFVGQIMKASGGKANPARVQELVRLYLEQQRSS